MVGSFSKQNCERVESARLSISFSETNSITSCPRSRSTSATAMPGKRWPPVPPHAMTAFIQGVVDLALDPRGHSRVQWDAFFLRLKHGLTVNVQEQTNPEQAGDQIRAAIADEGQR